MDTYLTGHRICQRGPGPGILAISEGERPPTHSTRKLMSNTQTIKETYNGWTNYETWNFKLWADNDEPTYKKVQSLIKEVLNTRGVTICSKSKTDLAVAILSHSLRELAHNEAPELETSFYSDVMMASVREVDYYEIAKSLLED